MRSPLKSWRRTARPAHIRDVHQLIIAGLQSIIARHNAAAEAQIAAGDGRRPTRFERRRVEKTERFCDVMIGWRPRGQEQLGACFASKLAAPSRNFCLFIMSEKESIKLKKIDLVMLILTNCS